VEFMVASINNQSDCYLFLGNVEVYYHFPTITISNMPSGCCTISLSTKLLIYINFKNDDSLNTTSDVFLKILNFLSFK
jgi:hypothetical protein